MLFISCLAFVSHHTLFLSKELFPSPCQWKRHRCKTRPAFARLQLAEMVKMLLRGPFLLHPSLLSGSRVQTIFSSDVRVFVPRHRPPWLAETPGSCLPGTSLFRVLPPARGSCGEVCVKNTRGEKVRLAPGRALWIPPLPSCGSWNLQCGPPGLAARPCSIPSC